MKRNLWKKTAAFMLALTLAAGNTPIKPVADLFGSMAITASAEGETTSGTCGENATWELDLDTGVLTISGTGAMYDYNNDDPTWQEYIDSITSVEIASGITYIGACAFYYCESLTEVTIPYGVTSIGNSAFYGCVSLTEVTIPGSVTSIGDDAFNRCQNLTEVTIPYGVTSIGKYAFDGCGSLTEVTIPDSVTSIGDATFYNCSSLTSVTIPDSVTSIGAYAFCECTSLSSVTIPDSVTSIGAYAFCACDSLSSVTLPNSLESIEESAFYNCNALQSVTIPSGVKSIGDSAFDNFVLKEVAVKAETPPALGNKPFDDLALRSIYVPAANVDDYKSDANWSAYADRIESKVESGNCGAQGDNVKWELDLVTGVLTISGTGAMAGYDNNANRSPWWGNPMFTSVIIESGVTGIGNGAFVECSSLTSVTIPDSVTSIGNGAFYDCESLPSVTIPGSVTSIGVNAFDGCTSLNAVIVKSATPPELSDYVFDDTAENLKIYVPAASVEEYKKAENWSDYANKISSYELTDGQYKQTAQKDGTYYTRFVFVVPKAQFAGKEKAKFTATYNGKDYTYETTSYYTGVISNGIEYTAASADSALFVVTISSGSYIYNDLTCTLDFE